RQSAHHRARGRKRRRAHDDFEEGAWGSGEDNRVRLEVVGRAVAGEGMRVNGLPPDWPPGFPLPVQFPATFASGPFATCGTFFTYRSSHATHRAHWSSTVSRVSGPWSSYGYMYSAAVFPSPCSACSMRVELSSAVPTFWSSSEWY